MNKSRGKKIMISIFFHKLTKFFHSLTTITTTAVWNLLNEFSSSSAKETFFSSKKYIRNENLYNWMKSFSFQLLDKYIKRASTL